MAAGSPVPAAAAWTAPARRVLDGGGRGGRLPTSTPPWLGRPPRRPCLMAARGEDPPRPGVDGVVVAAQAARGLCGVVPDRADRARPRGADGPGWRPPVRRRARPGRERRAPPPPVGEG